MKKSTRDRKAPRQQLSSQSQALTITVQDDEEFPTFLLNLLSEGYLRWLQTNGRVIRLGITQKIPLYTSQSWKGWRRTVYPAVRKFWEEYTHKSTQRQGTLYARCNDLITRVLRHLQQDSGGQPLYHGKPLSQYRLANLMGEEDARLHTDGLLSEQVCRRYARLWFVRRKCANPTSLTHADLQFLKKHDPDMRIEADCQQLLRLLHRA